MTALFRNIQKSIKKGLDLESNDAFIWIYLNYARAAYHDDGRSILWEIRRKACASDGGCCARECGCCEKLLYEYPLRNSHGTIYLRKVYAHCTSECACCVITHGVYEPDPHLPDPGFVVAGRSNDE
ncbi:hypothetical protein BJX64DRAFT_263425 [Aspergillus heterothallicus]